MKEIAEHKDKNSASMNSEKVEESFEKIDSEPPLEDKRRTRAKSTGRPPSQEFIKGSILQRSDSMDNLSTASEDDESEKHQHKDVPDSSSKFSQLVSELKKPSIKIVAQKDNHNDNNPETGVPTWMKMLPKRNVSASAASLVHHKNENSKTIPPWMQEIQRKREHKLSLKSDDETLEKVGQECKSSHQNIKYSTVEINSAVIKKAADEKQIRAKSYQLDTREISSNKSSFQQSNKVIKSYSFLESNINTKDIPVIGYNEDSNKTNPTKNEKIESVSTSLPVEKPATKAEIKLEESNKSKSPISVGETAATSKAVVNMDNDNKHEAEVGKKNEPKEISKTNLVEPSNEDKALSGTITTNLTSETVSNSAQQNSETAIKTKTFKLDKYDATAEFDKSVGDLLNIAKAPTDNNAKLNETTLHNQKIDELPKQVTVITACSKTMKPNEVPSTTKEISEPVKQVKMDTLSYSLIKPNETTSDNSSVTTLLKETKTLTFTSPAISKEVIKETTETTENKENKDKPVEFKEISGTKEEINIKRETKIEEEEKVIDDKKYNNASKSIHLLLKEIEDFTVKHELHTKELKTDLQKLQMSINQQHEELRAFIEKTKAELNALTAI
ncbi:hypothetical protein ILUMI_10397 [Ignelater luminosus]|uniref:Uncharacterized protein n=1 Tax=Ignelater luminosus TaxID=2038154 RepID=A0A8K0D775_IGNLU|nr:hypothetical protein ILUMI_10397 [Ignelater luminosus]